MPEPVSAPPYRSSALTHWANIGLLLAGGAAGLVFTPLFWAALVPLQLVLVWVVPDMKRFRNAVELKYRPQALQAQRKYYLEELWGLRPDSSEVGGLGRFLGMFVQIEQDDYDQKILRRNSQEVEDYLEMRSIVSKLREMKVRMNLKIEDEELHRLDEVINGYLRILIACRPLAAVAHEDVAELEKEMAQVETRLAKASPTLRPVLLERQRLLKTQLERIPKLQATLELLKARAQAIPYQLKNIHSQVLTDPGTQMQSMLDEIIERNEVLADPLADLSSDQAVRDLLDQKVAEANGQRRILQKTLS